MQSQQKIEQLWTPWLVGIKQLFPWLNANHITYCRPVFTVVAFISYEEQSFQASYIMFAAAAITDYFDGVWHRQIDMMWKSTKTLTNGAKLDHTIDKIVIISFLVFLWHVELINGITLILIVLCDGVSMCLHIYYRNIFCKSTGWGKAKANLQYISIIGILIMRSEDWIPFFENILFLACLFSLISSATVLKAVKNNIAIK